MHAAFAASGSGSLQASDADAASACFHSSNPSCRGVASCAPFKSVSHPFHPAARAGQCAIRLAAPRCARTCPRRPFRRSKFALAGNALRAQRAYAGPMTGEADGSLIFAHDGFDVGARDVGAVSITSARAIDAQSHFQRTGVMYG